MAFTEQERSELLEKVRNIHAVFIGSVEVPGKFMDLSKKVDVQETRIRRVEQFQWVMTGAGLLLTGLYHIGDVLKALMTVGKITTASAILHIPWLFTGL